MDYHYDRVREKDYYQKSWMEQSADGGPILKENCWHFHNCGREPEGVKAVEEGECPAATSVQHDGTNSGINGGRYCWRVAGTNCVACGGKCMPNWADTERNCLLCDFFIKVRREEGSSFRI
jgi:hypothetical protein